VIKHRAHPRNRAQILLRDDPGFEFSGHEFGEHLAKPRISDADRRRREEARVCGGLQARLTPAGRRELVFSCLPTIEPKAK
jgi:hypothetical protein